MSEAEWSEVDALLEAALDLPPDERDAFLADPESGAPDVRKEVRRLLEGLGDAVGFLAEPAAEFAAPLLASTEAGKEPIPSPLPGPIGPYRLLREIGRGGMGAVYLAERDDEHFQMRVALKLVPRGMDSEPAFRRFREERQILASLEHPNIARLLDGGVTSDGLPWFALEYVEGLPIDRYCRENGLTLQERIDLFCQVCDAVQLAHRNLVVHRDLKPGNILVTREGVPKLLDFGIAKLLEPDSDSVAEPLTRAGMRVLTPEYASPEQIRSEGVTTATDIYSLGVLLFELLTGERPYRVSDRSPGEVERTVCEVEPTPPSEVASPAARRRLRGDLDTIVLKTLRKEPERRYSTVEQLSSDLRLHLAGRPVTARPDTWTYRFGKLLRRHGAVISAAAFAGLVGAGGIVYHAGQVTRERDAAQRETVRAERVSAFLVELFQSSDPFRQGPPMETPEDLLAAGVIRLEESLEDEPETRARLFATIGQVYERLGRYEPAIDLQTRALELRQEHLPPDHPDHARNLHHLGILAFRTGAWTRADSLLTAALELRAARHPPDHPDVLETLNDLAVLRTAERDLIAADSLHRVILTVRRAAGTDSPGALATTLSNLGVVARGRGVLDEAEAFHREALEIRLEHLGPDHPYVADSHRNLALALHSQSRFDEAEIHYRTALETLMRELGPLHPRITSTLNSLASLLRMTGDYDQAEPLHRQAVELASAGVGPRSPEAANAMTNLSSLLFETGRVAEAEALVDEVLAIHREAARDRHPAAGIALHLRGTLLHSEGRDEEAGEALEEALEILREHASVDPTFVARPLLGLGAIREARGDLMDAEPMYLEALSIYESEGSLRPEAAAVLIRLASTELLLGRGEEAEGRLRKALELRSENLPPDHWRVAEAEAALGGGLLALGRASEAEPLLRRSADRLRGHPGSEARQAHERAVEELLRIRGSPIADSGGDPR